MATYLLGSSGAEASAWLSPSLTGVLAGIILKWVIDAMTEGRRRRREDRLRYVSEKRAAYADFLHALRQMDSVHESARAREEELAELEQETATLRHELHALQAGVANSPDTKPRIARLESTLRERDERIQSLGSRNARDINTATDLFEQLKAANSTLALLAPERVQHLAQRLTERIGSEPSTAFPDAEKTFLLAAREDLGIPDTWFDIAYRRVRRWREARA